jgi:hypothetical protein
MVAQNRHFFNFNSRIDWNTLRYFISPLNSGLAGYPLNSTPRIYSKVDLSRLISGPYRRHIKNGRWMKVATAPALHPPHLGVGPR